MNRRGFLLLGAGAAAALVVPAPRKLYFFGGWPTPPAGYEGAGFAIANMQGAEAAQVWSTSTRVTEMFMSDEWVLHQQYNIGEMVTEMVFVKDARYVSFALPDAVAIRPEMADMYMQQVRHAFGRAINFRRYADLRSA